jgi:hypothetical protein
MSRFLLAQPEFADCRGRNRLVLEYVCTPGSARRHLFVTRLLRRMLLREFKVELKDSEALAEEYREHYRREIIRLTTRFS